MTDRALFSPYDLAGLPLPNRCVMAPMVRARATPGGGVPDDAVALCYTQRAGAGLIVAEALAVSPGGANYFRASGLHTAAQRAGWRRVVRSVHAAGGRIVAQINHAGRATHVANLPEGMVPVGPSDVPAATSTLTSTGFRRMSPPRALTLSEIAGIVDDFRAAAVAALDAGFDGVEIHAANGYLIDQFLKDSANRRGDRYGGSVANRIRFLLEVVDAVTDACPGARIGLRLAPAPRRMPWMRRRRRCSLRCLRNWRAGGLPMCIWSKAPPAACLPPKASITAPCGGWPGPHGS